MTQVLRSPVTPLVGRTSPTMETEETGTTHEVSSEKGPSTRQRRRSLAPGRSGTTKAGAASLTGTLCSESWVRTGHSPASGTERTTTSATLRTTSFTEKTVEPCDVIFITRTVRRTCERALSARTGVYRTAGGTNRT